MIDYDIDNHCVVFDFLNPKLSFKNVYSKYCYLSRCVAFKSWVATQIVICTFVILTFKPISYNTSDLEIVFPIAMSIAIVHCYQRRKDIGFDMDLIHYGYVVFA